MKIESMLIALGRTAFALGFSVVLTVVASAQTVEAPLAAEHVGDGFADAADANAASSGTAVAQATAVGTPVAAPAPVPPAPSSAVASPAPSRPAAPGANTPPPGFGAPPSGEIPILFNNHHVYSKPDTVKKGRVLAAIVRGKTVLVPLYAMFEQMGAQVVYNAQFKTIEVAKGSADILVTLGKPEVNINGEKRPLDVPPQMYRGTIVVPIRVLSEGMGAYVQWVPGQHVVVIRYNEPTPPPEPPPTPTPAPTLAPTAPPTKAPATPVPLKALHVIAVDYLVANRIFNEFGASQLSKNSFAARLENEFDVGDTHMMASIEARRVWYMHNQSTPTNIFGPGTIPSCSQVKGDPACVTVIGGYNQTFVPAFMAKESDMEFHAGFRLKKSRIYPSVGVLTHWTNYGYPSLTGPGFGLHKIVDADQKSSLFFQLFYYPTVGGTYTVPFQLGNPASGLNLPLRYSVFRYSYGSTFAIKKTPFFIEFGSAGDKWKGRQNAPSSVNRTGSTLGLGYHF